MKFWNIKRFKVGKIYAISRTSGRTIPAAFRSHKGFDVTIYVPTGSLVMYLKAIQYWSEPFAEVLHEDRVVKINRWHLVQPGEE